MKKFYFALITAVLLLCLNACGGEVLPVKSADYEGLTEMRAADPDEEMIKAWNLIEVNPYYGNYCRLSVSAGNLVISNFADFPRSFYIMAAGGYFVGTRASHYDNGWVMFCEYYWALEQKHLDLMENPPDSPKLVVKESCCGFVEIVRGEQICLLSCETFSTNTGSVYELRLSEAGVWGCERLASFKGSPYMHVYDKETQTIYMVTDDNLLAFSVADRSLSTLADLSLWRGAGTSIVQLDGKLYIGMEMGIYEYDLASGETKWYPMPYEKLIPKEKWNPEYDEESARMYKELGFYVSDLSDD